MCLMKKVGTLDSYVADTDITVFKVLSLDDKSLQYGFQYAPGETYGPVELGVASYGDIGTLVYEGFHAYLSLGRARVELIVEAMCDGRSYSMVAESVLPVKLVAFTIPAGARYILGDDGDIVCDTIVSSPW